MILVDTDVLIWHLRGHPAAAAALDQLSELVYSAVSHMEVLQGVLNKNELQHFHKMLEQRQAIILPVNEAITYRAIGLLESMSLSHGLEMPDAIIAATALTHNLPILTGNLKHFKPIQGLSVEPFVL